MVDIKIYNASTNPLPRYARYGDAGMDVYARETVEFRPYETNLIKTGIFVAIPDGYELQIRPRSGLSLKTKLRVSNSPGTIDSAYRGEICIIMDNISKDLVLVQAGDRIAQIVLQAVPVINWLEVNDTSELGETGRATQGFGSTGV